MIFIYKFDNVTTFKHQSFAILVSWKFLEKDKTSLHLQINIAWWVFIGPINWRGFYLSHIWTIKILSLNVKVCIRFIIFLQISFCFFFVVCLQLCQIRGLCTSFTSCLFPVEEGSKKFEDCRGFRTLNFWFTF